MAEKYIGFPQAVDVVEVGCEDGTPSRPGVDLSSPWLVAAESSDSGSGRSTSSENGNFWMRWGRRAADAGNSGKWVVVTSSSASDGACVVLSLWWVDVFFLLSHKKCIF